GDYYTQSGGNGTQLHAGDTLTSSQTVYIYATNGHCYNESSFNVHIYPTPVVDRLSDTLAINYFVLPPLQSGSYYSESRGQGTAFYPGDTIDEDMRLYIYATSGHCFDETSFYITVKYVLTYVKYLTPNGDGYHDTWQIKHTKLLSPGTDVYIYDRSGRLLGTFKANTGRWDGTYQGKPLPADDYWFKVRLRNGELFVGHIALIR
ncbi:MAG: T9SS type B sorting domain-containing protein, partial [Chlorobi bacterium]|nr:T9SS type B sorting domain-containing protein [Chlorobiota bacterium]